MKRHIWLVATTVALFGLQAPLCALACITGAQQSAPQVAENAEQPCHGESPDPGSEQSPASREDCSCELSTMTLVPASGVATSAPALALLPLYAFALPVHSRVRMTAPVSGSADLPPPDIMLLKSTLLI